jgi:integrase
MTKNNIQHAAALRSAALFALKTGNYNEAYFFPQPDKSAETSKRLGDLCERYKPLKSDTTY